MEVEGYSAFAKIMKLPIVPGSLSSVTPPHATLEIIQHAITTGVKKIWMQPGAEDPRACHAAREAGLKVIDDGSCILVLLARKNRLDQNCCSSQPRIPSVDPTIHVLTTISTRLVRSPLCRCIKLPQQGAD